MTYDLAFIPLSILLGTAGVSAAVSGLIAWTPRRVPHRPVPKRSADIIIFPALKNEGWSAEEHPILPARGDPGGLPKQFRKRGGGY